VKLQWTIPAAEQLEQAYQYIAERNLTSAEQITNHIVDITEMLGKHPQGGRRGRVAGTREFAVPDTPFVIAYSVRTETVFILAVYHAARKWPENFESWSGIVCPGGAAASK
jgi:toxin ParE1/3/4